MTDRASCRGPLEAAVRAAVAGGVDWVQVRDRDAEAGALLEEVERVAAAAREGARERAGTVRVLVNRRGDVALAADADGLHLGFDALPAAEARHLLEELAGPDRLVGVSTHSPEEAAAAAAAGADYAHLAPIFDPVSKPPARPALGTAALRRASEAVRAARGEAGRPFGLLAQGGLVGERVTAVLEAGATGIAVTGAVLGAADPGEAAAHLRATLDGVRRPRR